MARGADPATLQPGLTEVKRTPTRPRGGAAGGRQGGGMAAPQPGPSIHPPAPLETRRNLYPESPSTQPPQASCRTSAPRCWTRSTSPRRWDQGVGCQGLEGRAMREFACFKTWTGLGQGQHGGSPPSGKGRGGGRGGGGRGVTKEVRRRACVAESGGLGVVGGGRGGEHVSAPPFDTHGVPARVHPPLGSVRACARHARMHAPLRSQLERGT
jgi:hypothetical protein